MRATAYFSGDQKEWSNVFWYTVTAGTFSGPYDYTGNAANYLIDIATAYTPFLSSSVKLRGCSVEVSDGTLAVSGEAFAINPGLGGVDPLPYDVAAVVSKITTQPGRSGRGRFYVAGLDDTLAQGSYLTPTGATDLNTWSVLMLAPYVFGGITFQLAHFSKSLRVLYPIQQLQVVALLGTQRRRRGVF